MSASHNSSGSSSSSTTAVQPTLATQISSMGSSDPNWLGELKTLGYTPSSGSWNGINTTPTNGTASGLGANATAGGQSVATPVSNAMLAANSQNPQMTGNASLLQLLANTQLAGKSS